MGMLSFNTTCPHCLREKAVLIGLNEQKRGTTDIYDVHFVCNSCNKSGIAAVKSTTGHGPLFLVRNNRKNILVPDPSSTYSLYEIYPKIEINRAPDNTPDRAARFYVESKTNLQRGNFETAVMLCRKVIDIATRNILGEDSNKEKLSQRISMLHGKGLITEQMKDWAHIVRIDSNGAVHSDEEFTQEEAEEMIGFTEVFLLYAFTLPAMVEAKKHAREQQ
ncbi:DUF4145 domain-containing protein [Symbiopectobacterium sp. RP]|uniref:DUF4145 domain-containing protein n=1 Tax=Rhodnius prolixus TaxID=13249 RepID=T1HIX8_RHOPR